jgi:acetone carboxylase gamma subunit
MEEHNHMIKDKKKKKKKKDRTVIAKKEKRKKRERIVVYFLSRKNDKFEKNIYIRDTNEKWKNIII